MINIEQINNSVVENKVKYIADFEKETEKNYEKLAEKICSNAKNKPLILISGPSGSGKTTLAIKLYKQINALGFSTCYLSMDKYFKNFSEEEKEMKKQGKIDLESPDRVDKEFLNSEIDKLLNNEKIFLPGYSFLKNERYLTDKVIDRKGGFVIVEGIHALNPDLLGGDDNYSSRIYGSIRSKIINGENEKLNPCKIRLMRRMIRDKFFRGREFEETIKMFPRVQRGENQFIIPYRNRASFDIDTFVPFEISVYKKTLFTELKSLENKYKDVRDIVGILEEIVEIDDESIVPTDSLIREFIGGSSLHY